MAIPRTPAALLAVAALFLALYMVLAAGPYELRLFAISGIYVLLIAGYQLIFGHAGALSLAQGAFFGIGAYTAGILAIRFGVPPFVTLCAAASLSAIAAVVVALPVLRLETHYFALATLALAQGLLLLGVNWESLTGGANGLSGVPSLGLGRGLPTVLLVWCLAAGGCLFVWHLTRGTAGLAFQAMRERPHAAASLGLDLGRMRFVAFVCGAALAGLSGGLYAHFIGVVSPESLDLSVMVGCLTMTVIGGRTHPAGAVIGGFLLAHLPEWLRVFGRGYLAVYGAAALLIIITAPEGIAGLFARWWHARRPRARQRALPAPCPHTPSAARMRSVLQATGLRKKFGGVVALDGVDIEIAPGEIAGLIGPNGSGKTTLANVLTGAERADAGTILLSGSDVTTLPAYRKARAGMARTFQTPQLVESASAHDNLALAHWARTFPDGPITPWTPRHLILPGSLLPLAIDTTVNALPAGPRRQLEVARAALQLPALLVLDEPSAGLTPVEKKDLARNIRALAVGGAGVLLVEHDMAFLFALATRVVCLVEGRVIADGPPAAVRTNPAVLRAYLGDP